MSKPLVSIVTVVYNGAATLEDTILSVKSQTFNDREYIIVDGGSKDPTPEIIRQYAGTTVTRWISEPDKGIYDAMNKGIRMASGEWIYFLGSDDRFHDPHVLADFFNTPGLESADLAYGDVLSPSYKGRYDGEFSLSKLLSRNISHQAAFYRRRLFALLGDYDLRYKMHADWDFNLRCFSNPVIKTKYTGILVASFGAGGVSAGHDLPFLREKLIPAKLRQLNLDGVDGLRRMTFYDEWWRCLRNGGIRTMEELASLAGDEPIPAALRRMIRWQRQLPPAVLRFGPVSKVWMLGCYAAFLVIP